MLNGITTAMIPDMAHALHRPVSLVADLVAASAGTAFVSLSALSLIHGIESVIGGGLVIVILSFRVAVHIRSWRRGDDA